MDKDTRIEQARTVGLDLGDRHSHFCVLGEDGDSVEEGRVATTSRGLRQRFAEMAPARIAIEVGTHSPWVEQLLQSLNHEVLVANPRKLRLIYGNDSKSDVLDAEQLARLARVDPRLLHPIQHRSRQCQEDLSILRSRHALVEARTKLINHVRGAVKSHGARLKSCSGASFHKQATEQLPEGLQPALLPLLETIGQLTLRIRHFDRELEHLAQERYPQTELLRQVTGVGVLTALSFVLTLEDPHRFRRSRSVGAYLGLRPRRDQSGGKDPELGINKAGDTDLRRLLVSSAHYILGPFGPDSDLRRWGLKLAARGGKNAKKRAVVAVARKLAVLLHHLWVTAEVYEPLRNSLSRERISA